MSTLCIYHGNCADGFTAAWAAREALGDEGVAYHPGVYQSPPPEQAEDFGPVLPFTFTSLIELLDHADVKAGEG